MWWKNTVATAAFIGGFLLNPGLLAGCQPSFQFGEAELVGLLASVENAGQMDFRHEGATYRLRLKLRQQAGEDSSGSLQTALRVAHACTDRSFLRSAGACGDSTTMFVEGILDLHRLQGGAEVPVVKNQRVEGRLFVPGLKLERASLDLEPHVRLQSDDGKTFRLVHLELGDVAF